MSATGRGGERITADNYPTPAWAVRRLLEALPPCFLVNRRILEPCAGDGAIVRALASWGYPPYTIDAIEVRSDACEALLRIPGSIPGWGCDYSVTHADALATEWEQGGPHFGNARTIIITNPPFEYAQRFIEKAIEIGAQACFLERVGFGQGPRADLFRTSTPSVLELPDRPSFAVSLKCMGNKGDHGWAACEWAHTVTHAEYEAYWKTAKCPGCAAKLRVTKTDATGYAWYCWNVWKEPRYRMLASTSLEERSRIE